MVVLKKLICFTSSTVGMCAASERTDFQQFRFLVVCCGLEMTDLCQFSLWEGMVVLKELIFLPISSSGCNRQHTEYLHHTY